MSTNYYEELDVSPDATSEEIRAAYFKIAKVCHPDRARGDENKIAHFRRADEAYHVLIDSEKRRTYDRGAAIAMSVEDLFARTETGRRVMQTMLPSAKAAPQRGTDLIKFIAVSEQMLQDGGVISITVQSPYGDEEQELALEIPPQAHTRPWCRLEQLGSRGKNGAPNGDLWIHLQPRSET